MVTAIVCVLVGLIDFNALALVLLMSAAGFFSGLTMPSRDMIVRAVTPRGAYGRVFGFVSTGFNIAGIVSPIIFGQLLDHGHVREIFFFMAVCALLSIATVAVSTTRKRGGMRSFRVSRWPVCRQRDRQSPARAARRAPPRSRR